MIILELISLLLITITPTTATIAPARTPTLLLLPIKTTTATITPSRTPIGKASYYLFFRSLLHARECVLCCVVCVLCYVVLCCVCVMLCYVVLCCVCVSVCCVCVFLLSFGIFYTIYYDMLYYIVSFGKCT